MENITGHQFDVIIAGGGPGGAAAAYFLGEAGLRVLVLEKETLPRYKACGGAISVQLLEEFPFSFDPVIEARIKEISYAYQGENLTFPLPHRPILMVMRAEFDQFLLSQAQAEICQRAAVRSVEEMPDRVIVQTKDGRTFESRYLIGADGPSSVVARSLGLRRGKKLLGAIEVEVPAPPEVMARYKDTSTFIIGEISMGYLWIFSKAEHLSVGIGALHPKPGELQSTFRRVMESYGISIEGLPLHGHPVPLYSGREKISTARTLLVGDAAGLVDPLSGEGIRYAVTSGRLAAEAILSGEIHQYEPRIQRQIGASHRYAKIMAEVLFRYPGACFDLCAHHPSVKQAIAGLLSGRGGYSRVILSLVGSLPLFLVKRGMAVLAHSK